MTATVMGTAPGALFPNADGTHQPEADNGHDYPMPAPHVNTGKDFWLNVIGPATLSVAASQIAVDKATDTATREFANFELREAVAVVAIVKDLNIPSSPMDAGAQAFLEKLRTTPRGADFDRTYTAAELANHEFLRDLADSYLTNSAGNAGGEEAHTRRLAALAITAFKEHVVLTKNILHTIGA